MIFTFCQDCGEQTEYPRINEATAEARIGRRTLYDWIDRGGLHSMQNPSGHKFIRTATVTLVVVTAAFIGGAVLGAAVGAFSRRAARGAARAETPTPAASKPSPPSAEVLTPPQVNTDIQGKLLTLMPYGFEPEEMLVTQKQFILAIENRSGLADVAVQLLSGNRANQLQTARMARGKVNADQLLELPPGDYILTEAHHPNWICKLTVNPR